MLFEVLKLRSYDGSDVTVADVNKRLDDIVVTNETEGRKAVSKILKDLFLKMDAMQQKWLVRLILKSVRLGVGSNIILSQMHPDAGDYFEVEMDMGLFGCCLLLGDQT